MEPISSLNNPRVKNAAKLREHRPRVRQGRLLIDGIREIGRAFRSGVKLVEVFVCEPLCQTAESRQLLAELATARVPLLATTEPVFAKLAFGQRAEGIVAVAEQPVRRLEDLALPAEALIAVLAGIEKPGNVGAVLRSADGAGVAAVIVSDGGTDLYNPNCIRASLGTIFTTPVCSAIGDEVRVWLQAGRWRVVAARVDAPLDYTAFDYRGRTAIVLGSEAAGLSAAWQTPGAAAVRLPLCGSADSLNVSATAAVMFYEALRQRSTRTERGASAP